MPIIALSYGFARSRRLAGFILLTALAGLAACAQAQTPPADPAATAVRATPTASGFATCPDGATAQTVWPKLSDVQPQPVAAGAVVTVTASGGYAVCAAGAINESARSFQLTLDGAPVGSIMCYVNHCEGQFALPAGLAAGDHVLHAEGGSQLSLAVR